MPTIEDPVSLSARTRKQAAILTFCFVAIGLGWPLAMFAVADWDWSTASPSVVFTTLMAVLCIVALRANRGGYVQRNNGGLELAPIGTPPSSLQKIDSLSLLIDRQGCVLVSVKSGGFRCRAWVGRSDCMPLVAITALPSGEVHTVSPGLSHLRNVAPLTVLLFAVGFGALSVRSGWSGVVDQVSHRWLLAFMWAAMSVVIAKPLPWLSILGELQVATAPDAMVVTRLWGRRERRFPWKGSSLTISGPNHFMLWHAAVRTVKDECLTTPLAPSAVAAMYQHALAGGATVELVPERHRKS